MKTGGTSCERARQAVSLALDDELSELERIELDRHLATCERCSQFANRAAVVAQAIRSTPTVLPRNRVELQEERRRVRPVIVVAAAVAVALAAAAGAVVGTVRSSGAGSAAKSVDVSSVGQPPLVALQFAVPVRDPRAHGADF